MMIDASSASQTVPLSDLYNLMTYARFNQINEAGIMQHHPYMTFKATNDAIEKLDYYYGKILPANRSHEQLTSVVWKPVNRKVKDQHFTGNLRGFNRTSVPNISLNKIKWALKLPEPEKLKQLH